MTVLLVQQILPLIIAGAVAGLLAGLLGIGGGVVLVPVLLVLLAKQGIADSVSMHVAVATSMATIIFTAVASARSHWKRGSVDEQTLRQWAPWIMLGALLGGSVARWIDGDFLRILFVLLAIVIGLRFLRGQDKNTQASLTLSSSQQRISAASIGLLSSWLGIGGGSLSVPLLTATGKPVHRAIGTSSALGLLIAVPAVFGFIFSGWNAAGLPSFSLGYVHVTSAFIIVVCAISLAPVGVSLSHRINQARLKQVFGLFLLIAAARMAWKVLVA